MNLTQKNEKKHFSFKFFFSNMINNHYIVFTIVLSFILNLAIESGARHSIIEGVSYIFAHPLFFLYNVALLIFTFSIGLLCRKRIFSLLLIVALWTAAGVTNSILLIYRRSPFIAADFTVLKSALAIMDLYMTKFQMFAVGIITVLLLFALIFLLLKEKKKKINYRKIAVLLAFSIAVSVIPSDYITAEKNQQHNTNITDEAYKYGFVCCFLNSIFNSGVNKPSVYSKHKIKSIASAIKNNTKPEFTPNIVVVQLESFIDPYKIPGTTYSVDPVPNFRELKKNYSSGLLNVSVYGGGTANTEFEVLTGMNLKYFGIGEYPYETILKSQTVESVCYNLNDLGYVSHAMHNHTGTFYDRYKVYKNLGFDTFVSSEYMNGIERNILTWEKSDVFTDEVFSAFSSTPNQDFVFIVTSLSHGKYPADYTKSKIKVKSDGTLANSTNELEFFAEQLNDEDKWLGAFVKKLQAHPEPTMVVIYGDHMPALDSPEEIFSTEEIYQTEYVIWANYEIENKDADLYTYNLMATALNKVNIHNGHFTQLHQYATKNNLDCSAELKNIQYDVTNGKKYLYGDDEKSPCLPTDMKLGVRDIVINDVNIKGSTAKITGKNFTPSSVVCTDSGIVKTTFIDENTLSVRASDIKNNSQMRVAQRADNLIILGYSQPFNY